MLNLKEYRNDIYGAETLKCDSDFKKMISRCIDDVVGKGHKRIYLYPVCDSALYAESILKNFYGITSVRFVDDDEKFASSNCVISLKEAAENEPDSVLLIVDNSYQSYDTLRNKAYHFMEAARVYDAFPVKPLYKMDSRIISLEMASREVHRYNIPGAVAEVGVYRGYFAEYINEFFPDREFYLFDTFEGFDVRDCAIEHSNDFSKFESGDLFLDTSTKIVLDKMAHPERCHFNVGYFPETTKNLSGNEKFCFVHLDTDLYAPILAGLEYFYPRLAEGGYIFVHDFNGVTCKGVRAAVEEFSNKYHVGYVCLPDSIEKGTAVFTKK